MDDGGADLPVEFPRGHQCGNRRRRDRLAAFVDHEAAVGVAVESKPDIGAGVTHIGLQIHQVRRVQRIGLVIGKRSVELKIRGQQGDRVDHPKDRRRGVTGHAVAGVHGHPQRT
ncbi:Uncharacterised protein [Mycobacterium tuberculosis]|nr:Uncharacterised protein [Mycobacterium tuberculosis]